VESDYVAEDFLDGKEVKMEKLKEIK